MNHLATVTQLPLAAVIKHRNEAQLSHNNLITLHIIASHLQLYTGTQNFLHLEKFSLQQTLTIQGGPEKTTPSFA